MYIMPDQKLPIPVKFDWDKHNQYKNLIKHKVNYKESEQVLFNEPKITIDIKHSTKEKRFTAFGITDEKRPLYITFTIRNKKIRIISARPMSKNERKYYAQKEA